jgi:hypothetical protein
MIRPVESDYTSPIAYTRALEYYCDRLEERKWVGLTKEDRQELAGAQYSWEDLLTAAEARLKEKNT